MVSYYDAKYYPFFSGSCGGKFTDANGHMSSPSYPNNYPPNTDCIYIISQPTGTVIQLQFLNIDIMVGDNNDIGDHLEIRDGPSNDSDLLLNRLQGSEILAPIQSSQNQLWMK